MIAVLTAGGCVDTLFAHEIGTTAKALAPLGDQRLIDRAVTAVRACGARYVVVIGGDEVRSHCAARVDTVLPAAEDGRENLESALRLARGREPLLLVTCDLPFITPSALAHFLSAVGNAQIAMPTAGEAAYIQQYPGAADHVTSLGGERIANGSVFYFSSEDAATRAIVIARRLFHARKNLLRMATLLDPPLLLRFLVRRLRIEHLETYAERRFGISARVVRDASPALCYDIDTVEDYRYAVSFLERV
ncbi:MAG TPA: nucleotidyltransferase family protein [Candidatus Baltobacteraceae bacterium]|jgi:molybdopterin-guanine dinucleotide biosynthesis protein A|nr:nucleotidyltransferase family protein [Candidatus Baltobacteraceae bacterium]